MEAAPKQPEAVEAVVTPEMLQEQHGVVQELHAELDRQFGIESGANLTGETLAEADAMAQQLSEEMAKLNEMTGAFAAAKSAMPGMPPADYPGTPRMVEAKEAPLYPRGSTGDRIAA